MRKFNVDSFSQALTQLTTDQKIKERASLIGQKIRSENGVRNTINFIYRDLDFATKRIKEIAAIHKRAYS